MLKRTRNRLLIVLSILGLGLAGSGGLLVALEGTASADSPVIYNNLPAPRPGNVPSEAFEATSTSEFGGQVGFVGSDRFNPEVTVLMSSWGCQSGHWFSQDCQTTPGSTFSEPITLNVYNVNSDNSVGSKVASLTDTFNIPFRPSASSECKGQDAGKWYEGNQVKTCFNGFATPITFDLNNVNLPDTAILSVAYNTSDFGAQPYGHDQPCNSSSGGCGYDSLNVGLVSADPTVGSYTAPNSDYLNSSWSGAYCDNGEAGTGSLRYDTGNSDNDSVCPDQPAFKVKATRPSPVAKVTGQLILANPHQEIGFHMVDAGPISSYDHGTVYYRNFDYPGGLKYSASVQCVNVSGNQVTFMFQIPSSPTDFPGLSGLYVVASITDNGKPVTNDVYGHTATADLATALGWCQNGNAPVTDYPVTNGHLVFTDL